MNILFHNFFVLYGVTDIDVRFVGEGQDGGVKVEDVGWFACCVQVHVETLHEGCFARTWSYYEGKEEYRPCRRRR